MKKFSKFTSLMSLILTLSILLCFFAGCDLVMEPLEDGETKLQKEYCTATVDEDFSGNKIIIRMFPEYENVEYSAADFVDVGCVSIHERWRANDDHMQKFILTLNIDSKENVLDMIKILEKRDDVYCAYPRYVAHVDAIPSGYDARTSPQWAIPAIRLPNAWDINTGSDTIYVGVIDTGIDIRHPDLAGRVDVVLSKNFLDDFDTPFADANGHGTRVAGIIGAQWDSQFANTEGCGGVCWNVKLVSLRVGTADGDIDMDAVAEAIDHAEKNGIKILNCSVGSYAPSLNLKTAISNYSGIFICSAGNETLNTDNKAHYPSCYTFDNIISVGASMANDAAWTSTSKDDYGYTKGSNYGATTVDLFAPGYYIYSCTYEGFASYDHKDGTSMATPFVTGVAALMLAEKPSLTPAQIKAAILGSVDKISALSGKCVSGGRLNAYKALKAIHTDHSYDFSYSKNTSSIHNAFCRCGNSIGESHTFTYTCLNNDSGTHKATCHCGYSVTEAHTYKITSTTVSCTQCSYSHSHSHMVSYTSIGSLSHKVTCDCGVIAYEAHDKITTDSNVSRCSKCGYGIELWSIDPPVTSQKYTLNEYR